MAACLQLVQLFCLCLSLALLSRASQVQLEVLTSFDGTASVVSEIQASGTASVCVLPALQVDGAACPAPIVFSNPELTAKRRAVDDHEAKLQTPAASAIFEHAKNGVMSLNCLNAKISAFMCAAVNQTNKCAVDTDRSVKARFFAVERNATEAFLQDAVMTTMPKIAADFLKLALLTEKAIQTAESFASVFPVQDGNVSHERFEIGHVFSSVIYDGDNVYILVLAPAITARTTPGCGFTQPFRRMFASEAQDVLRGIAVDAVTKPLFVPTIDMFHSVKKMLAYQRSETHSYYSFTM